MSVNFSDILLKISLDFSLIFNENSVYFTAISVNFTEILQYQQISLNVGENLTEFQWKFQWNISEFQWPFQ